MPDSTHLIGFILAGWLLNLTPGADVLYIVRSSLRGGHRSGLIAALGITTGCFVHVFAAALGIAALISASATAFAILKWIGACYLFWMGLRVMVGSTATKSSDLQRNGASAPTSLRKVFVAGFWTNALNPKVMLFFLAFVPQFIDTSAANKTVVFLSLGILFNVNSMPINAGWALAAAWLARRERIQRATRWLDRAAGAMFIAFAACLALSNRPLA